MCLRTLPKSLYERNQYVKTHTSKYSWNRFLEQVFLCTRTCKTRYVICLVRLISTKQHMYLALLPFNELKGAKELRERTSSFVRLNYKDQIPVRNEQSQPYHKVSIFIELMNYRGLTYTTLPAQFN